ncbi:MAG: hypothetical protein HZB25_03645 [Candidatus Eisenbacteria bacterium]|nr:hypothetical protein [Candidatus Eisenbacteria bacterium]
MTITPPAARLRRLVPHVAVAIAWAALYLAARTPEGGQSWNAVAAAELPWRFLTSFVGVEAPQEWVALVGRSLPWAALGCAVAGGLLLATDREKPGRKSQPWPWLAWAALGLAPLLGVAGQWSAYYFSFAAAGLCLAAGAASLRGPAWVTALLPALLLISGQATTLLPVPPEGAGTSRDRSSVSPARLEYVTSIVTRAFADIPARVPAPRPGSLFLFEDLPDNNGLISGDGPAIRLMYSDPTLAAAYLGDVGERTRLDRPLYSVRMDATGERFVALEVSPAMRSTLRIGFEVSGRTGGALAALRYDLDHGVMGPAEHAWNLGYLRWQAGDTAAAAAAWAEGSRLEGLDLAAARTQLRAAGAVTDAALRLGALLPVCRALPRESSVLVEAGEAAVRARDPQAYALYFRAAMLAPADSALVSRAVRLGTREPRGDSSSVVRRLPAHPPRPPGARPAARRTSGSGTAPGR